MLLPGLLSSAEAATIRQCAARLRVGRAVGSCERPHNTLVPLRWDDEPTEAFFGSPERMRRLVLALNASDLRWTSGYVSIKDPHSAALWWHQDWWCWDHPASFVHRAAQVAIACYLCPTTVTTGALRVLPSSHHDVTDLHPVVPLDGIEPHTIGSGHPATRDHPRQVTIAAEPGDAVVLDYRVLHGTHPNAAPTARECLIMNFAPDWGSLPDEIRAHLSGGIGLPAHTDRVPPDVNPWLPTYAGEQRDLRLNRDHPATSHANAPSGDRA